MSTLQFLVDLVLHLDRHLVELVARYDLWIYALLAAVIFCQTAFVLAPFLPGDSLLFGAGALSAVDTSGTLHLSWLVALLGVAAITGNTLNYWIGRKVGRRAFEGKSKLLRLDHLRRAEDFFQRHGGIAIVLSLFMPVVRSFTPFVAGVGRMNAARFQLFNMLGGAGWVALFLCGGYLFGNLPVVKENFGLVTLLIIGVSVLPFAWMLWRERVRATATSGAKGGTSGGSRG